MSRRLVPIVFLLTGCATEPVKVPYPVPVPEACLAECPYQGPSEIRVNGQLLEAYRGRLDQVGCYQARLACVREATESVARE